MLALVQKEPVDRMNLGQHCIKQEVWKEIGSLRRLSFLYLCTPVCAHVTHTLTANGHRYLSSKKEISTRSQNFETIKFKVEEGRNYLDSLPLLLIRQYEVGRSSFNVFTVCR